MAEFSEISSQLEMWYRRESGRYLLQQLQDRLDTELETAFGYHLAQLGVTREHRLFDGCRIRHCVYSAPATGSAVTLAAEADQLPLASDSVDLLIAHHALEFCDNPHQALREMHRVLTPQGHLYVIGFNPLSLLGAWLRLRGATRNSVWPAQWRGLSRGRLQDWLSVLGLETADSLNCLAVPPLGRGRLRRGLQSLDRWACSAPLPLGGVYLLHAIKQVPGNVRPAQRSRRARLIDLAVPRPVRGPRPAPTPCKGDTAA